MPARSRHLSTRGSYDICPICGWEDDVSQLRFPRMHGANKVSLIEGQRISSSPATATHGSTGSTGPRKHGSARSYSSTSDRMIV
jgi:hypothetical protein